MALIESGDGSGNLLIINPSGQALTSLTGDPTKAGIVRVTDSTGDEINTTENGNILVSTDNLIFYDQVDGSTLNTNLWTPSVSGMTITQTSGFITLNAASALTASAYAFITSNKYIPMYGNLPLNVEFNARVLNVPEANCTIEVGIGTVTGNSAPTDGAYFRWTPAGIFTCVINNGGTETTAGTLTGVFSDTFNQITLPPVTSDVEIFGIEIVEDHVLFRVGDVVVADIDVPIGIAFPFSVGRQQIFGRVYNAGTSPSLAPQLLIGQCVVKQQDLAQNKPWAEVMASLHRGAFQSPVTFASTANFTNSTNPASATLSNTAAGYATLGGRFQFAAPAGAVTDFALFAYQIPTGYQFNCTGIDISLVSMGAGGGATGSILEWDLAVNSTAVSLATADGTGTVAPRRIGLGMQSIAALAAVGYQAPDISRRFPVPMVCDSGRFLHVIVQIPVGLATASQIIRGIVTIHGYSE